VPHALPLVGPEAVDVVGQIYVGCVPKHPETLAAVVNVSGQTEVGSVKLICAKPVCAVSQIDVRPVAPDGVGAGNDDATGQ